jgi:magnesium chelatase subunit ChlD-like protein
MVLGQRRWHPTDSPRPQLAQTSVRAGSNALGRIHWGRTLVRKGPGLLGRAHLQREQRPAEAATLHLIALDNSGSMRQGGRLALAKGFVARLIDDAARTGDQVGLLTFGGQGVQRVLAPAQARRSALGPLLPLGGGGGTPLAAALRQAQTELLSYRRRHAAGRCLLWLLTDGRSLEQPAAPGAADQIVIVDFDDPLRPLGRCRAWAQTWGAEWRQPVTERPPHTRISI